MNFYLLNDFHQSRKSENEIVNLVHFEMVECEYLKLFIANCKNDFKLNSRRSLSVKENL